MPPIPTIPRPPKEDNKSTPTRPTDPTGNTSGIGGNGGGRAESPRSGQRAGAAGGSGGPAPAAGIPRPPRASPLENKLGEFFGSFSLAFSLAGDDYCAWIIANRSPALAHSWAELAKQNPAVKRVLEGLVEGSAWGGVIMSTLAIALPIAKHHGAWRGPDPFAMLLPGPPPDVAGNSDNSGTNGNGGNPRPFQWSKDGAAPAPSSDDDAEFMPTMPGSPPGVVTVASTTASHTGAR